MLWAHKYILDKKVKQAHTTAPGEVESQTAGGGKLGTGQQVWSEEVTNYRAERETALSGLTQDN